MNLSGKNIREQIHLYLLMAVAFTLAFPIKFNSWMILLCGLNWLLAGEWTAKIKRCYKEPQNMLFLLFFIFHIISMFMSDNMQDAKAIIERRSSLIALPLLLYGSYNFSGETVKKISFAFVCGVITSLLYCFFRSIVRYGGNQDPSEFFYHHLSSAVNINAVYMAAYTVLAIHIVSYYFKEIHKILAVSVIAFLLVACIMLNSKMMFAVLIIGALVKYLRGNINIKTVVGSGIFLTVAVLLLFIVPKTRERIVYEFSTNLEVLHQNQFSYNTHFTGTSLRLVLWKYCFQIQNEGKAFLTGVGTGDFQDRLNGMYVASGMYTGNPKLRDTGYLGYGPHNEYVEILFSMGVFALLLFLYILYRQIQISFRSDHYLFIQLMILMLMFCITESVLSTNKGIVFYVFFATLFVREIKKIN